jgi:flavin reductase ActVB
VKTSSDAFREAMSSFPSGATIVTTSDSDGRWWGFTASSFCSVSMEPALVLTCLANTAQCFPAFAEAARWNIHVLQHRHADLAMRFATRGAAKFDGAGFQPDADGLPFLEGASISLRCTTYSKVDGGDHLVLIGQVEEVGLGEEMPFVYFRRKFHALPVGAPASPPSRPALPVVIELDLGWMLRRRQQPEHVDREVAGGRIRIAVDLPAQPGCYIAVRLAPLANRPMGAAERGNRPDVSRGGNQAAGKR